MVEDRHSERSEESLRTRILPRQLEAFNQGTQTATFREAQTVKDRHPERNEVKSKACPEQSERGPAFFARDSNAKESKSPVA
jgi:hypothetical protein